jgi:serine/threonine protein kinase
LQVRLVLEYCDKGCLRDALDCGIFKLGPDGVNFLAVLDTAADVAKAMLHLHSCNVLHSDL